MRHWCKISRPCLMSTPIYWAWTKTIPQKKQFFWSSPHKIEVIITSLTEKLELPYFAYMTTFPLQFESRNKLGLVKSWTEIMTSWHFFQNIFVLRKPGVAIFVEIIKIVTMFTKTTLKYSRKVRRIRNYVSQQNLYLYFLI